jgi:hypothetical protein
LDVYKKHLTVEEAKAFLWQRIKYTGLPMPNLLVYSGRGLYVEWLLDTVRAWPENVTFWGQLQTALYEKLEPLGADPLAKDVSRILRIAGTLHTMAGRFVHVEYLHDDRYTIEEIAAALDVPDMRKKRQGWKKTSKTKVKRGDFKQEARSFTLKSLYQQRIGDLETLNELRGGFRVGCRERACFLFHNWLHLLQYNSTDALNQVMDFNSDFSPPLSRSEVLAAVKLSKPYTTVSNKTVIQWLGITDDEQRRLSTLISRDETLRRQRFRMESLRRKRGTKPREAYLGISKQQREAVDKAVLDAFERCPGASQCDLAVEAGVHQSTVSRALRRMDLYTRPKGNPALRNISQ